MCDHCHFPEPVHETRRSFLRKLAEGAVSAGLLGITRAAAQGAGPQVGHTGWARLVTSSPYWNCHQDNDPKLADFIRMETKLKFDASCYTVEPTSLDQLCAFPFIFTNNLWDVHDPQQLGNIREYLYRGGFIYIDGCVNRNITPSFRDFFNEHVELFGVLLRGSELRKLPPNHPIFQAYFPVQESRLQWPPHPQTAQDPSDPWAGATQGLYGIFDDDRLIVLLSLDHLQCGWPEKKSAQVRLAMQQIANIYVYALAH